MEAQSLRGKVALVTGSARRVGKSIALALAAEGMALVVHHSGGSADQADEAAAEIRALGSRAEIVPADLRDPAQIELMLEQVRSQFGRLDVLVNSASLFIRRPLDQVTLAEWQDVLAVNLTAPFLLTQQAAPFMRESASADDPASIINIVDLSAFTPWKSYPHHSVSKSGLKMLTEVTALALAPEIRVNAIAPGPVLRDEGNSPERWQQIGERLPIRRAGHPADVARAAVFLATQPFVVGVTLRVDGGELLV